MDEEDKRDNLPNLTRTVENDNSEEKEVKNDAAYCCVCDVSTLRERERERERESYVCVCMAKSSLQQVLIQPVKEPLNKE